MAWIIEFDENVERDLAHLETSAKKRILTYLKKLADKENPAPLAKPIYGKLSPLLRFQTKNYRIICEIQTEVKKLIILVISQKIPAKETEFIIST